MRYIIDAVLAPLRSLYALLCFRRAIAEVHRLSVFAGKTETPVGPSVRALDEALSVVQVYGNLYIRYLRRARCRLRIDDTFDYTYFWPVANAIVFPSRILAKDSALWVASSLVHEATHVRIHRAGIRPSSDNLRRIEDLCTNTQIEFLAQTSTEHGAEAGNFIAWLEECRTAEQPWWSPALRVRRRREALSAAGAPGWLVGLAAPKKRPSRESGV